MSHVKIIGLGMACLDILLRARELPKWEHGTRIDDLGIEGGGPVATALVAAQRLGVPAGFIGTYGSDRLGRIKLETLVEHGLDVSRAIQRNEPEDQVVLVCVNSDSGERVFSGKGIWGSQQLAANELDRGYLISADFLHLDGFHVEAALQATRWMHAAGKMVMLDGSATRGKVSESMQKLVSEVDVLICGSGFGEALTGKSDLLQAGETILDLGPGIVVQTEGVGGSYTVTREEKFHTPAFKVDVVDTTGAGDVFHGAYLVGLLCGWDLHSTALFSTAVSAIKCTRFGGRQGIPGFQKVLDFLGSRGITLPEVTTQHDLFEIS